MRITESPTTATVPILFLQPHSARPGPTQPGSTTALGLTASARWWLFWKRSRPSCPPTRLESPFCPRSPESREKSAWRGSQTSGGAWKQSETPPFSITAMPLLGWTPPPAYSRHAQDPGVEVQGLDGVLDPQHGLLHHKVLKHTTATASHSSDQQQQREATTPETTRKRENSNRSLDSK